MKAFYFGCIGRAGHYLHDTHGQHVHGDGADFLPWKRLDGALCPGFKVGSGGYNASRAPEVEGEAALHHLGGWTALAFWDRSVDPRGGCNSVFVAEGTYGPAAMLAIAREHFPQVWARFTFEVRIVQRANEVANPKHHCAVCGKAGFGAGLDGWAHDPPGWFRRGEALACSVACVTKAGA